MKVKNNTTLKRDLHRIIDRISDSNLLNSIYYLFINMDLNQTKNGISKKKIRKARKLEEAMPWSKNILFEGLDEVELSQLAPLLVEENFKPGEYIILEGEIGDEVYFIESGKVEILKDGISLGKKHQGNYFGAMAILDRRERSADVKAIESTKVQKLSFGDLSKLSQGATAPIYQRILINHLRKEQDLLRNMNHTAVAMVKEKLLESELRNAFGSFFVNIVLGLVLYIFLLGFLREWTTLYNPTLTSIGILILFGLAGWVYVRNSGFPLKTFGLRMDNFREGLREVLLWSVVFMGAILLFKWLAVLFLPAFGWTKVWDFRFFYEFGQGTSLVILTLYILFTFVQEFIARGAIQGGLMHFLTGKYVDARAILISTLLFSSTHLFIDTRFALMTIVPGIFWGILYAKYPNVLLVTISHALIGVWAMYFLGIFT